MFNTVDLYDSVFRKNAQKSSILEIISGYASPKFLERVIKDFPSLKIILYIGMSDEGVLIDSHIKYKTLQEQNTVEIYYQSKKIGGLSPTHMKVYRFTNGLIPNVFIGSANFTENGFFHNREVLTKVDDELDELFTIQKENSISCKEPQLASFIDFKIADESQESTLLIDEKIPAQEQQIRLGNQGKSSKELRHHIKRYFDSLGRNIKPDYHSYFKVQIAFNAIANNRWYETGINGTIAEADSVLRTSDTRPLYDLFPENEVIVIYTDDSQVLYATLTGLYDKDIKLSGTTWYQYVVHRLGIESGTPISNEDLTQIKCSHFEFERINRTEYYMWLTV